MNKRIILTFFLLAGLLLSGCISGGSEEPSPTAAPTTTIAPTTLPPTTAPTVTVTPPIIYGNVTWQYYDDAVAQSVDENKHVYVYMWRQSCPYCDMMKDRTFKDPDVVAYLEENFAVVAVNVWSNDPISSKNPGLSGAYLGSAFEIPGAPSSGFIDPDGILIGPIPGYKDSEEFLLILEYVATDSYKSMTYQQFIDSK